MKLFACVLAALAATGLASCPNQCSGHGRCSDNDVCECYKQTGTTWRQRAGYSGADCSQRTCPLGTSFDYLQTTEGNTANVRFSNGKTLAGAVQAGGAAKLSVIVAQNKLAKTRDFQVRILAAQKYQWKFAEQTTYTAAQTGTLGVSAASVCEASKPCELTNSGSGSATTGVYIHIVAGASDANFAEGNLYEFSVDHQEGAAYMPGNSNSAHQQAECSGRGACDRASGRCACFDGFNGEACQRTTCPNDCSGHGVCQSQKRFAADAGGTYSTAYDNAKEMGCACDGGFRGPDCSAVECPSGDDPMGGDGGDGATGIAMDCSGRGLCDYSSGECGCFKGFYGERCEYQTNFV